MGTTAPRASPSNIEICQWITTSKLLHHCDCCRLLTYPYPFTGDDRSIVLFNRHWRKISSDAYPRTLGLSRGSKVLGAVSPQVPFNLIATADHRRCLRNIRCCLRQYLPDAALPHISASIWSFHMATITTKEVFTGTQVLSSTVRWYFSKVKSTLGLR